MVKRVVSIMLVVVMLGAVMILSSCAAPKTDRQMIEERVNQFISCVNVGNIDGSLECLDSHSRSVANSALSLMNSVFGQLTGSSIDLKDLLNLGSLFMGDYASVSIQSFNDVTINGDSAVANITIFDSINGTSETQTVDLPLKKENGDWFLSIDVKSML